MGHVATRSAGWNLLRPPALKQGLYAGYGNWEAQALLSPAGPMEAACDLEFDSDLGVALSAVVTAAWGLLFVHACHPCMPLECSPGAPL